ncbi:hypothetical protein X772_10030 [Mesorhizobium sp. LSJC280B00]|nr:hypothetical protein X772_10030 [Mesorhizobium sp. LSJC280B00]
MEENEDERPRHQSGQCETAETCGVIANPAVSTTTGWPVGFWWSELPHPWFAFTERGYVAEIFSPGGRCPASGIASRQRASSE